MKAQFRVIHGHVSVGNGKTVPVKIIKVDDRISASVIEKGDEPLIPIGTPYVKASDNKAVDYPFFDLSKKTISTELEKAHEVVFLVSVENGKIEWICWTHKSDYVAAQQAITTRKRGHEKIVPFMPEDNHNYRLTTPDNLHYVGTPREIVNELTRDLYHDKQEWPEGQWEKHNGRKFAPCEPPVCPELNRMLLDHKKKKA